MKPAALAALLALALLAGCGSAPAPGKPQAPSAPQAEPAPQAAPAPQAPPAPQAAPTPAAPPIAAPAGTGSDATPREVAITVKMTEYSFEPKEVDVPLGARVKLTVVNVGEKQHDFNLLDPYDLEGDILQPGKSQVFEFTADKAGTFQIVCSERGHKAKGMVGSLVVK